MGRVGIFIDGGYLDFVLRDLGYPRIDFGKLAVELAGPDELLRVYYYHCLRYQSGTPTKEEAERFGRKQRLFHALGRLERFQVDQILMDRIALRS